MNLDLYKNSAIDIDKIVSEIPVLSHCLICRENVEAKLSTKVYTNYGGVQKEHSVCSTECESEALEIFGGRISKNKCGQEPFIKRNT